MANNWLAPVLTAGGGLLGSIIGSINSRNENRWARDWNEKMYKMQEQNEWLKWHAQNQYDLGMWQRQNEYNEQQWHKMNEYNSPMAQMARFKEAGLNPNLIYGQGSTTSPIATANFGSNSIGKGSLGNATGAPNSYGDIGASLSQGLMSYVQLRESAARTNNLEAQNQVLQQDVIGRALDNIGKGTKNEADRVNLDNLKLYSADAAEAALEKTRSETRSIDYATDRANVLQQYTLEDIQEGIRLKKSTIENQQSQRALQTAERALKELELEIRQSGGNPNDPAYMKYIIFAVDALLKNRGISLGDLMRKK